MTVTAFVNEGLGHSSHLVDLGDGTALVIDPARLPTEQRDHAARVGLTIAFTADTHTHADYISAARSSLLTARRSWPPPTRGSPIRMRASVMARSSPSAATGCR